MNIAGIVLLSAALSIDAFGIGVSCSVRKIKNPVLSKLIICVISVAVTGAALIPLLCGASQLVLLCAGELVGSLVGRCGNIRQLWLSLLSAGILVLMGVLRIIP